MDASDCSSVSSGEVEFSDEEILEREEEEEIGVEPYRFKPYAEDNSQPGANVDASGSDAAVNNVTDTVTVSGEEEPSRIGHTDW